MYRYAPFFCLLMFFASCKRDRKVDTSFYYWKTVYSAKPAENRWLDTLHVNKVYVRMMDIDLAEDGTTPVPVSPVIFQDSLSKRDLIPVVFIVNNVLKDKSQTQLDDLAAKLLSFVKGKVSQAGKARFSELQIDCDWTKTTRDNYFYLLKQIRSKIGGDKIVLSATLRLHQLKNLVSNGIPPVDRVMLMCYNMGNLRKYGDQNSILEEAELRKYVGKNLTAYPMPVDVGLPLFSWAVAFRGSGYIGIPKKITEEILRNDTLFTLTGQHRFVAKNDLAAFGLKKGDEIRWESVSVAQLQSAATYIANYLKTDTTRVIYFHLDETLLKKYTYENLEKTTALFR